ncbi:MAG: GGDEF domain-containing protein [Lachnospiraceae bacterium]|nr:GGDEF domain-containing protein [Lachnospiraceae bacterium]
MGGVRKKSTIMQLQVSLAIKIASTVGIVLVLIMFVNFCDIPNPDVILIAGLVLCSALFGFGGGITGAVIILCYTLFYYSTDHSITQFTPENLKYVAVSTIGIAASMMLVCSLKAADLRAFADDKEQIDKLTKENEHLKIISFIDPTTGIRSRVALRQDFDSYFTHEVTVMMMDITDFKKINERLGREEGDRVLRECGALITETFGQNCCYRYGGDEFLVIYQDAPIEQFEEKLESLMGKKIYVEMNGVKTEVGLSAGYVHDKLDDPHKLRELFLIADERMYRKKRTDGLYAR